jgi:hypothetical protein
MANGVVAWHRQIGAHFDCASGTAIQNKAAKASLIGGFPHSGVARSLLF